jgi:alpha-D-xyloside xylohydrolase
MSIKERELQGKARQRLSGTRRARPADLRDVKGNTIPYDPTFPEARKFVWSVVKRNYFDKGIKIFWLDEAEPEWGLRLDHYRYAKGATLPSAHLPARLCAELL